MNMQQQEVALDYRFLRGWLLNLPAQRVDLQSLKQSKYGTDIHKLYVMQLTQANNRLLVLLQASYTLTRATSVSTRYGLQDGGCYRNRDLPLAPFRFD